MKACHNLSRVALLLVLSLTCFKWSAAQTLHRLNTGRGATFLALSFPTDSLGVAVGDTDTSVPLVSAAVAVGTTDAGASWNRIPLFSTDPLYAAFFNDQTSGAVGGDNGRMMVFAGQSLHNVQLPEFGTIYGITYPSYDTVIAVGGGGLIYKSNDSGKTWKKIAPPPAVASRDFYGVDYWDDSTYWIVGHGGIVLYTEDAGTTWQRINLNTNHDLHSVSFPDASNNGWIAGDGVLFYTTDGGTTWTDVGTSALLQQVVGYDSLHAYAVGFSGQMLQTSNATSWTPVETGTTANFYGVAVPSMDHILICGDSGIVMSTLAVSAPKASFAVSNDTFPRLKVGAVAVNSKLIITNTSNQVPVTIVSAEIDSSEFTLDPTGNNTFPFKIPPGQTHALDIRFRPAYPGPISSLIRVASNEAGSSTGILMGVADPAAGVATNETATVLKLSVTSAGRRVWLDIPGTMTGPLHIELMNVLGNNLLSSAIHDDYQVDGSSLLPGVYLFRVSSNTGSTSGKFVIH